MEPRLLSRDISTQMGHQLNLYIQITFGEVLASTALAIVLVLTIFIISELLITPIRFLFPIIIQMIIIIMLPFLTPLGLEMNRYTLKPMKCKHKKRPHGRKKRFNITKR